MRRTFSKVLIFAGLLLGALTAPQPLAQAGGARDALIMSLTAKLRHPQAHVRNFLRSRIAEMNEVKTASEASQKLQPILDSLDLTEDVRRVFLARPLESLKLLQVALSKLPDEEKSPALKYPDPISLAPKPFSEGPVFAPQSDLKSADPLNHIFLHPQLGWLVFKPNRKGINVLDAAGKVIMELPIRYLGRPELLGFNFPSAAANLSSGILVIDYLNKKDERRMALLDLPSFKRLESTEFSRSSSSAEKNFTSSPAGGVLLHSDVFVNSSRTYWSGDITVIDRRPGGHDWKIRPEPNIVEILNDTPYLRRVLSDDGKGLFYAMPDGVYKVELVPSVSGSGPNSAPVSKKIFDLGSVKGPQSADPPTITLFATQDQQLVLVQKWNLKNGGIQFGLEFFPIPLTENAEAPSVLKSLRVIGDVGSEVVVTAKGEVAHFDSANGLLKVFDSSVPARSATLVVPKGKLWKLNGFDLSSGEFHFEAHGRPRHVRYKLNVQRMESEGLFSYDTTSPTQ